MGKTITKLIRPEDNFNLLNLQLVCT